MRRNRRPRQERCGEHMCHRTKRERGTTRFPSRKGAHAALDATAEATPVKLLDGKSGKFSVAATDKQGRDLRAHGRLQYVGKHYLRFAGSGEYFLKAGADAPETLLAYADFDDTVAGKPKTRCR